ncbi:MAG: gamma-glutamyl-gamma-aminobutyrate hydrolase family protein [Lachnospiraceae bacterium]
MNPIIGIIICGITDKKQFVSDAYIQAIRLCGGIPLILPLTKSTTALTTYAKLCDGFLFCGGADITPLLFGEEPAKGIGKTNVTLDLFQIRLMKQALSTHKPILGICRGMQVLNVACGGSILQDLNLETNTSLNHMQTSISRKDISHKVFLSHGTLLSKILGRFAYTNSYHHQAIKELGNHLIVSGLASDDTIEAIEIPNAPFVVGVQWHPECMIQNTPRMKDIFIHFIQSSR